MLCEQELPSRYPALQPVQHKFRWAVSMAHSRAFVTNVNGRLTHIIVPGVDMANHCPEPSASVR